MYNIMSVPAYIYDNAVTRIFAPRAYCIIMIHHNYHMLIFFEYFFIFLELQPNKFFEIMLIPATKVR